MFPEKPWTTWIVCWKWTIRRSKCGSSSGKQQRWIFWIKGHLRRVFHTREDRYEQSGLGVYTEVKRRSAGKHTHLHNCRRQDRYGRRGFWSGVSRVVYSRFVWNFTFTRSRYGYGRCQWGFTLISQCYIHIEGIVLGCTLYKIDTVERGVNGGLLWCHVSPYSYSTCLIASPVCLLQILEFQIPNSNYLSNWSGLFIQSPHNF